MKTFRLSAVKKRVVFFGVLFLLVLSQGCKKFITVNVPPNSTNSGIVYNDDATATAVLTGIYTNMSVNTLGLKLDFIHMSLYLGLSADELTLFNLSNPGFFAYYSNGLTNVSGTPPWTSFYPIIFTTNAAIEGLNNATGLSPVVKQQLLGEAKFMRAYSYFYLVNLYGDVPLALSTDPEVNRLLSRSPKAAVWQQIIADLTDAQALLSPNYVDANLTAYSNSNIQRVRPTSWAATALLARAYLYTGEFVKSEIQATSIINNTSLFSLVPLNNVFLMNSKETIWSLQPVRNSTFSNSQEGRYFVLPTTGPSTTNSVYLSNSLFNSFEAGDLRKSNWINSVTTGGTTYYYPYKYKIGAVTTPVAEYDIIFRLAEQYLIRSEARVQQNNLGGAQADINTLRARAGLSNTIANDKSSIINVILHERQVELFSELGQRWLDLKRTGTIDAVMSISTPAKGGGSWNTNWQLFPVPLIELQRDPNLVQNPGY